MAENQKSFFNKLRTFFNIGQSKNKNFNKTHSPVPGEMSRGSKPKMVGADLPGSIKKVWEWWIKENLDTQETLKNRVSRYDDLGYMYYNNTVISMATELYADETVQADSQSQILTVTAKDRNVEKYITEFYNKIGITQSILRSTAFDLVLYGDHFWITPSNKEEGITKIIPVDVYSVKDRIEFNAIDAEKKIKKSNKVYSNLLNKDRRLQVLNDMLQENKDDISKYFISYLFGFQVESLYLAPWNVSHFRRFTSKSEFYPYGRPLFINSISPFRQLQSSKNLMAMARVYKFPKEHFEVEVDENMTEVEKWNKVNEAREEYLNLGVEQTGLDEFGVGGAIWTPKGLLDYSLLENRMDIGDIADVEMLRDDMILGTRVPKGYLIVDRASFGTSGQALLHQFKPFGRAVFSLQSSILNELIQLVKLQFVMTGDYDVNTPFEVTMPFPIIEETSDRIRTRSDTMRLASDLISNLQSALGLGRDEALPPDVVVDIFSKLSFLDPDNIKKWVTKTKTQNEKMSDNSKKRVRNIIKERMDNKIIKEAFYTVMRENKIQEGVFLDRHFKSSIVEDYQQKAILKALSSREGNRKLNE